MHTAYSYRRKKKHFKINGLVRYDEFYLVNYLQYQDTLINTNDDSIDHEDKTT